MYRVRKHRYTERGFVQFLPLILLGAFAITTFVIGTQVQKQRTTQDIRSRASTCLPCGPGTCPDGWSYGKDDCAPQASCPQRDAEACANHQKPSGGGQPSTGGGGGCPAGQWSCNGHCADTNTQNMFNSTWCDGQKRWLWQAAGNNSSCGGAESVEKSKGPCSGSAGTGGTGGATGEAYGKNFGNACAGGIAYGTCNAGYRCGGYCGTMNCFQPDSACGSTANLSCTPNTCYNAGTNLGWRRCKSTGDGYIGTGSGGWATEAECKAAAVTAAATPTPIITSTPTPTVSSARCQGSDSTVCKTDFVGTACKWEGISGTCQMTSPSGGCSCVTKPGVPTYPPPAPTATRAPTSTVTRAPTPTSIATVCSATMSYEACKNKGENTECIYQNKVGTCSMQDRTTKQCFCFPKTGAPTLTPTPTVAPRTPLKEGQECKPGPVIKDSCLDCPGGRTYSTSSFGGTVWHCGSQTGVVSTSMPTPVAALQTPIVSSDKCNSTTGWTACRGQNQNTPCSYNLGETGVCQFSDATTKVCTCARVQLAPTSTPKPTPMPEGNPTTSALFGLITFETNKCYGSCDSSGNVHCSGTFGLGETITRCPAGKICKESGWGLWRAATCEQSSTPAPLPTSTPINTPTPTLRVGDTPRVGTAPGGTYCGMIGAPPNSPNTYQCDNQCGTAGCYTSSGQRVTNAVAGTQCYCGGTAAPTPTSPPAIPTSTPIPSQDKGYTGAYCTGNGAICTFGFPPNCTFCRYGEKCEGWPGWAWCKPLTLTAPSVAPTPAPTATPIPVQPVAYPGSWCGDSVNLYYAPGGRAGMTPTSIVNCKTALGDQNAYCRDGVCTYRSGVVLLSNPSWFSLSNSPPSP